MAIVKEIGIGLNTVAVIETYDNELYFYSHIYNCPVTGPDDTVYLKGTLRKCENALKRYCKAANIIYK